MATETREQRRLRPGWFRAPDGHTERIGRLTYWRGRWRLRFGFCPLCDSSPPRRTCPVCQGSTRYGRTELTSSRKMLWRFRFETLREPSDV